jgi:ferredoxin
MVMSRLFPEQPAAWLESIIGDFINHSEENTLQNQGNDPAFESPLVGFASGADPLWESYKKYVGPFHWTPLEIFDRTFPGSGIAAQDLTVISWVLPQTAATKADNRKETFYPAERWARARIFGEEVNVKLRKHVMEVLQKEGYKALAPQLSSEWSRKDSPRYVYASTWSERHAAYAVGLGTFGLCDGLITPIGKAVRVGSVIANIQIRPTPRPYVDHHAYCLFYTQGLCGKCIPRCPVGALSESGHDKKKCRGHIRPVTENYVKANFGFEGYGCGLCQTAVPCESKIPTKMDVS